MSIKKIEMRPKSENGNYGDILYPKTSTDMVVNNDGTTIEDLIGDINSLATTEKNLVSAINEAFLNGGGVDEKIGIIDAKIDSLDPIALSGDFNDLKNKPLIPVGLKNIRDGEAINSTEQGEGIIALLANSHVEGYRNISFEGAYYSMDETGYYLSDVAVLVLFEHFPEFIVGANLYFTYADGSSSLSTITEAQEGIYIFFDIPPVSESIKGILFPSSTPSTNTSGHVEGGLSMVGAKFGHAEGNGTKCLGQASHSEGVESTTYGVGSHVEGYSTTSLGDYSHAEGDGCTAIGIGSHTEGKWTNARGNYSHAEGHGTSSYSLGSHAEGQGTKSDADYGHAEGVQTTVIGVAGHAEGYKTKANTYSHSEGQYTGAYALASHAEGSYSEAFGTASHAEGSGTIARSINSHAQGEGTQAYTFAEHVMGRFNKVETINDTYVATGNALVIGNGTGATVKSNAFRVTYSGAVYGLSAFNATGADYAEWFEWLDGNTESEDRVARFVSLDGDKIKLTQGGDEILGVMSACPSMVGDAHDDIWSSMYLKDVYGRTSYEQIESGEIVPILNPQYDPSKEYIPRSKRKEWGIVGLLGKILVYDDGTCEVNGYCENASSGIATKSNKGYRVMKRVDDNLIQIFFK